ncbi:unnamed protein product [Porites evermanni]|uniref:Uncharacterized protein n=1 Tax=Porites evermanni TaxID=104178 RepID=A0ABN8Q678_9CNID|nr:unnamed protein product [Porites evermanni]
MESTKNAMEDVGLQWNSKRCAVVHTDTYNASELRVDENICISDLEEGNQYKLLGFLETVRLEQKMSCSAQLRSFFVACLSFGQVPI